MNGANVRKKNRSTLQCIGVKKTESSNLPGMGACTFQLLILWQT